MARSLASTLRIQRHALGLTQLDVARRARVSQGLVALLEGGRFRNPSLAVLRRLAKALRATVGELVEDAASRRSDSAVSRRAPAARAPKTAKGRRRT